MWTILILFILWILSMELYLPVPVVLILFAALVSGTTVTISFALARRKAAALIVKQGAPSQFLKKAG